MMRSGFRAFFIRPEEKTPPVRAGGESKPVVRLSADGGSKKLRGRIYAPEGARDPVFFVAKSSKKTTGLRPWSFIINLSS